jgi:predicted PurR-regulated permease PerM
MTGEGGVLPPLSKPPPQVTPRTVLVVLLTALALFGALYLLRQLQDIVRWLVIGIFLAVALTPIVDRLEQNRVRRSLAILLVYLALLLALGLFGALIVPPLVEQVEELVEFATNLSQQPGGAEEGLRGLAERFGIGQFYDTLREQASTLPSRLGNATGPLLAFTTGILTSITAFLSILLITFFLLLDGRRFVEAGLLLFAAPQRPRLRRILEQSAGAIASYIKGSGTLALIAGTASFIALTILDIPYALLLGVIIAILTPIPLVGGTLGAVIVGLVALFVDPVKAGIFLVYYLIYQQVENNLLQPFIFGRNVKLHPLAIFLAVLAGAQLAGILGALLAIPVAEIIRIIGVEWLATRARQTGGESHPATTDASIEQVFAAAAGPAVDRELGPGEATPAPADGDKAKVRWRIRPSR